MPWVFEILYFHANSMSALVAMIGFPRQFLRFRVKRNRSFAVSKTSVTSPRLLLPWATKPQPRAPKEPSMCGSPCHLALGKEDKVSRISRMRLWVIVASLTVTPQLATADTLKACLGEDFTTHVTTPALPCCVTYTNASGATYTLTDILDPNPGSVMAPPRLDVIEAGPPNRWNIIPAWGIPLTEKRELEQARRLREGEAIFKPSLASLPCARLLLDAELEARTAEKGLWRDQKPLSTSHPAPILEKAGSYVIAVGRILTLGKTSRTIYLNFGPYWKLDLTATISAKREGTFSDYLKGLGLEWQDLEGRVVEIRGFVMKDDGPLIDLVHPAQLGFPEGRKLTR